MEGELDSSLAESATVDGHDFGSGEMNIFIETDEPALTFAEAQVVLGSLPRWTHVRVAHREATGNTYTVLWPVGQTEFKVK